MVVYYLQKRLFASRITTFPSEFLSDVVEGGGYSLVGVPGRFHHQTVEKDLIKVRRFYWVYCMYYNSYLISPVYGFQGKPKNGTRKPSHA